MTLDQRLTVSSLQAQGFTISNGPAGVLAVRGNDYRLVTADGKQQRARGARK